MLCKFAPLEFEIFTRSRTARAPTACKFAPLEFEIFEIWQERVEKLECKFAPLEFEKKSHVGRQL